MMTATWAKFAPTTAPTTALVFVVAVVFVGGGGDGVVKFVKDGFPGSYLACKNPHIIITHINYVYQEVNITTLKQFLIVYFFLNVFQT